MRRMAVKKQRPKTKAKGTSRPRKDPTAKRAGALARRITVLADALADQVARWSRLGEPRPGEVARVLALLESVHVTLGGERGDNPEGRVLLRDLLRDVIGLVQAGS